MTKFYSIDGSILEIKGPLILLGGTRWVSVSFLFALYSDK